MIHLGVHNFRATDVLSNANAPSLGRNSCKKMEHDNLNSAHQANKLLQWLVRSTAGRFT